MAESLNLMSHGYGACAFPRACAIWKNTIDRANAAAARFVDAPRRGSVAVRANCKPSSGRGKGAVVLASRESSLFSPNELDQDREGEALTQGFDRDGPDFDFQAPIIVEPKFRRTLAELLQGAGIEPLLVKGELDVVISGLQDDSRHVGPGDLFVCCVGSSFDGHDFSAEAGKKGAVAVIANKDVDIPDLSTVVLVSDTNAALSSLAAFFYGRPSDSLAVVGITGTNGKTTTTYLVRSIYESMGVRTGLIGTIAYYIHGDNKQESNFTTPTAVQLQKLMATMVQNGSKACVMEVSSHALAQNRCKDVDFDVAVFTNLTRDHFDYHETEDNYKKAKGKLFEKMVDPARHRKVINIDDPHASYFVSLGNSEVPVITFGMDKTADVYPLNVQFTLFETKVTVRTPQGNIEISSGLIGRHNVYNILTAVSVGIAVKVPLADIVQGIEALDAVPGRFELVDEDQPFAIIVDYAHTPDALSRLLDAVRECQPKRIITVIGCGGDRDRGKRPLMAQISASKSDISFFTSDNPRNEDEMAIINDMLCGIGWNTENYHIWSVSRNIPPSAYGTRVYVMEDRAMAIGAACALARDGDAVVVAGKGHETYQQKFQNKKHFDDREKCRELLAVLPSLLETGLDSSEFPFSWAK